MSETLDRIMAGVPDYYENSRVYTGIQAAKAAEWDRIAAQKDDLKLQLQPATATWGLRYFEEALDIPVNEYDSYTIRRSRIISKRRSPGNFSVALVKLVCEAFLNGEVDVTIDFELGQVDIRLISALGIPPNLDDLKEVVSNVVHAHLGVAYSFRYLLVKEIHGVLTINQLAQMPFTKFAFNTTDRG